CEAADWLTQTGRPLWKAGELSPERIRADVASGQFFLAECREEGSAAAQAAGTVKFQLDDLLFWPDFPESTSAYIHRLAVARRFAGRGVSTAILEWAAELTRTLGRSFLRLDCDAARPALRSVYERFGFNHHSDRQVGPYFVARYELALKSTKATGQNS